MSAKQTYYKPRFDINRLPNDLLTEVFRHATWVPYGVDPSDLVPEKLQSSTAKAIYKEYRASLVTKRYLVRVCKAWYRLATLCLYEWVILGRAKNVRPLIRGARHLLSPGGPSCGQCTKRLDIAIRVGGDELPADDVNDAIRELLQILPNLEVMIMKGSGCSIGDWPFYAPRRTLCPQLKVLNWPMSMEAPEPLWCDFIKSHPDLTSVNVVEGVSFIVKGHPPLVHERITTLNLTIKNFYHRRGSQYTNLPSLNRLSILFYDYDGIHLGWESDLLNYASPNLEVIQLNFFVAVVQKLLADTNGEEQEITMLRPLFSSCPNLKRVDVVLDDWDSHIIRHALALVHVPSTVSVIGIRVCSTKPAKHIAQRFLCGLKILLDSTASSIVIQFLDERTQEYLLHHRRVLARENQKLLILTSWLTPDGKPFKL